MVIKINAVGHDGDDDKWDHQGENIAQIFIAHGNWISGIQFQFVDQKGNLVLSEPHGCMTGGNFYAITLNYPSEFITYVSGYYDRSGIIKSIEFRTNEANYGPFGDPGRDAVWFEFHLGKSRQFFGFHGTSFYDFVTSIGVYFKPSSNLSEITEAVSEAKLEK